MNEQCLNLFMNKGILIQGSVPYVPQQNSRVKRKHRHILEMSRALRFQANLPKKFWGECIFTATFLINRLPFKLLSWKTPYKVLFGTTPDYTGLRSSGCLCYAYKINLIQEQGGVYFLVILLGKRLTSYMI